MRRLLVVPLLLVVGCSPGPAEQAAAPAAPAVPPAAAAAGGAAAVGVAPTEPSADGEYWTPERVAQLQRVKRDAARRSRTVTLASTAADAGTTTAAPASSAPVATTFTTAPADVAPPAVESPPAPPQPQPAPVLTEARTTSVDDAEFVMLVQRVFTRAQAGHLTVAGLFAELGAIGALPLSDEQRKILDEVVAEVQRLVDEASQPSLPGQWNIGDVKLPTEFEVRRSLGLD